MNLSETFVVACYQSVNQISSISIVCKFSSIDWKEKDSSCQAVVISLPSPLPISLPFKCISVRRKSFKYMADKGRTAIAVNENE